jgi:copper(I)-binding protein
MLMKVAKPIAKGDKVPLTLTFEGADKKTVVVKVEAIAQEKDTGRHQH